MSEQKGKKRISKKERKVMKKQKQSTPPRDDAKSPVDVIIKKPTHSKNVQFFINTVVKEVSIMKSTNQERSWLLMPMVDEYFKDIQTEIFSMTGAKVYWDDQNTVVVTLVD